MRRFITIFIIAASLLLAAGAWAIETAPVRNETGFSAEAADQGSSSFTELYRARVVEVLGTDILRTERISTITQRLRVRLDSGPEKGAEVSVTYDDTLTDEHLQKVQEGDRIVVGSISTPDETSYVMVDRYRLPALGYISLAFLALAVLLGRMRGLTSVAGLCVSLGILIWFVTPNILEGKNPGLVTFVGAGIIAIVSLYLAHGFSRRTSLSVVSTLITLGFAQALAYVFVAAAGLTGNASEEAFYVQAGFFGAINLKGLFLGGIVIGTLGILDDITTAQTAAVEEIHTADPRLKFFDLYRKGASVGREHITSLINTLVLTYAGASLPLFLLFSVDNKHLWSIVNSAAVSEEIVRTLVGSIALMLAVPISTFLAARYMTEQRPEQPKDDYWDRAVSSTETSTQKK